MAALIIAVTPFRRRAVDVSHSDLLPRLECSIRGFLTSTWPVSFSRQTAHHYPFQPPSSTTLILPPRAYFHQRGWPAQPVMCVSFRIFRSPRSVLPPASTSYARTTPYFQELLLPSLFHIARPGQ